MLPIVFIGPAVFVSAIKCPIVMQIYTYKTFIIIPNLKLLVSYVNNTAEM